jgi:5-formyltetrahydrofolate cyclo-ligase
MAVPSPSKEQMRAAALAERRRYARALTPEARSSLEAQLARIVLPHIAGARVVAGYHPLASEISPYAILGGLDGAQAAVLPWFAERGTVMMFREAPALVVGPWGMLQPPADAAALAPDVVLVPLVLGDRRGTRIGHGQGHYDRALARLREGGRPLRTIGIAWEAQISEEPIPADPWDVPLDAIATPAEWMEFR